MNDPKAWHMENALDPKRCWLYHGKPVVKRPEGWYRYHYNQALNVSVLIGPYPTIRAAAEALDRDNQTTAK